MVTKIGASMTSRCKPRRLAYGTERGAAIRGECGEILGHRGSCHVGDDAREMESRKAKVENGIAENVEQMQSGSDHFGFAKQHCCHLGGCA